ncbi:hypothetical protein ACHAWC_010774 [Mediolabrus comicus]
MSTHPPTKQLTKEIPFSLHDFLKNSSAELQQQLESAKKLLNEFQKNIAAVTPDNKPATNNKIISNLDEINMDEISALTLPPGIASAPTNSQDNRKSSDHRDDTSRAPSTNLTNDFGIAATVNNGNVAAAKDAAAKDAGTGEAAIKEAAIKEAATKEAATKEAAIKEAAIKDAGTEEAGTEVASSGGSVDKENISLTGVQITAANAADVAAACKQKIALSEQKIALLKKAREKAVDRLKEAEQAIIEKPVIRYARSNKKMIALGVISGLTNKWCYQPDLPEWCEGLREAKLSFLEVMKTKFLDEWIALCNRKEIYGAKKKKCQDIIEHFTGEGYEFVSVEFDDNKVPFFQTLRLAALHEKISSHLRYLKHDSKPTTTSSSSSSNTTTAGRASGSSSSSRGSSGSSSSRSSSSSSSSSGSSSSSSSSGSSKDDVSSKTCAVKKATKMNNIDDDMDGILDIDSEEEGIDEGEEVNKKKPLMTIKRLPKKRKSDDDDVEDDDVDDDNVVDLTAESPIKMPKLRPIKEPKKKRSHMHHTAASDSSFGTGDEVA